MREAGLLVVGASLAGLRAVEAARRASYDQPITLLGAEAHLPYDRPPLSKAYLGGAEVPTLPGADALADLGVDVRLGARATALSVADREVLVGDDELVPFDSLIIATGSAPVGLPGTEGLDGVHTLRTLDDATAVRAHVAAASRTVVIGAGFIGTEVASALTKNGADVTIVEAADVPLVRAVGAQAAALLLPLHARHGVDVRCGTSVAGVSTDGPVKTVTLSDGSSLGAELVLVGIGARPCVDWLAGSGLTIADGVVCDETLAAAPGIYAAGDVARWPNPLFDKAMRLEHWTSATEQAMAAARNAVHPEAAKPFETVPYFWSDWYGQRIQMVGVASEDLTVVGDPDEDSWLALYREGERLVGALGLNQQARIMKYRRLIARRASWADAHELATAA